MIMTINYKSIQHPPGFFPPFPPPLPPPPIGAVFCDAIPTLIPYDSFETS